MPNRTASQLIENQTVLTTVATTSVTAAAKATGELLAAR